MTLLGKILTVLIFVMSVMFAAFAVMVFNTHYNWRLAVVNPPVGDPQHDAKFGKTGLKFQLEKANLEKQNLEKQIEDIKKAIDVERAARQAVLAALEEKRGQIQLELETVTAELLARNAQLTELNQMANAAQSRLQETTDEVLALRQGNRDAREDRDAALLTSIQLTDQVNAAQATVITLQERESQLAAQITNLKLAESQYLYELEKLGVNVALLRESDPLGKRDGFVTAINSDDLVVISLGSDDGVRPGHEFDVYRKDRYLGRVVVRSTQPHQAIAEIRKDFQRPNLRIQKGDRIDSKLSVG